MFCYAEYIPNLCLSTKKFYLSKLNSDIEVKPEYRAGKTVAGAEHA
jgi:hypothetical protein